jgi:anti-anti-sigma factor
MSNASSRPVGPSELPSLGPLTMSLAEDGLRFTLTAPREMTLELPPDYEQFLAEKLEPFLAADPKPQVVMDLQGLLAISSRQLGLLLALHKTLADRYKRLTVTGVSDPVRHLLELTRTAQFFELD